MKEAIGRRIALEFVEEAPNEITAIENAQKAFETGELDAETLKTVLGKIPGYSKAVNDRRKKEQEVWEKHVENEALKQISDMVDKAMGEDTAMTKEDAKSSLGDALLAKGMQDMEEDAGDIINRKFDAEESNLNNYMYSFSSNNRNTRIEGQIYTQFMQNVPQRLQEKAVKFVNEHNTRVNTDRTQRESIATQEQNNLHEAYATNVLNAVGSDVQDKAVNLALNDGKLDAESKVKIVGLAENLSSIGTNKDAFKSAFDDAVAANKITNAWDVAMLRQYMAGQLAQREKREKFDANDIRNFVFDTMFEHKKSGLVTEVKKATEALRDEARDLGYQYDESILDEVWYLKDRLKDVIPVGDRKFETARERLMDDDSDSFQAFFHTYMLIRQTYPELKQEQFNKKLIDAINSTEEYEELYNDDYEPLGGSLFDNQLDVGN